MQLQPFLDAPLVIQLHAISATEALLLGAYVLWAKKGGRWHKILGYIWVTNMAIAITTSWFINELRMFGPFSVIHILSAWSTYVLIRSIIHARQRNFAAQMGLMRGLYFGGLGVAAVLAFAPGRVFNRMVFSGIGEDLGFGIVISLAIVSFVAYRFRRPLRKLVANYAKSRETKRQIISRIISG
ncbi:MAG: DUF2306 domain-containing protein [Hyphomicrobiaceae bacterium]|nr:DUF2306 domain-containing protein [Hyphomicrobiaceae bacterium]MCC0024003.1 DUF2306 domain-containing protein [Hyphomicrobiaceae bacterium]